MENLFPLISVNGTAKHGCHAGIPGTGPHGTVCSQCTLLSPQGARFVCAQYKTLTGRVGKSISPGTASCRYFEQRRRFNATQEG